MINQDLLSDLNYAHALLQTIQSLQNQAHSLTRQIKKPWRLTPWGIIKLFLLFILLWLLVEQFGWNFLLIDLDGFFGFTLSLAGTIWIRKLYIRQKNKVNAELRATVQQIRKKLDATMQDYGQNVATWLPSEFANLNAVSYFQRVVSYGQAHTLADAITLYEQYCYRNNMQRITSNIYNEVASLNNLLHEYY